MSGSDTLKEIYIDELRDLWSANDQMRSVLQDLAVRAGNPKLKSMLEKSIAGVAKHTDGLKALIDTNDGKHSKDHCKGMEGLVAEARKHALHGSMNDHARDVVIVAQYQRMCHYGLAGFGAAEAYARALGRSADEAKLKAMVGEIYEADGFASQLAEQSVNLAAAPA